TADDVDRASSAIRADVGRARHVAVAQGDAVDLDRDRADDVEDPIRAIAVDDGTRARSSDGERLPDVEIAGRCEILAAAHQTQDVGAGWHGYRVWSRRGVRFLNGRAERADARGCCA